MSDTTVAQWRPAPWFLLSPPQPKPGTVARPRIHRLLDECTRRAPITLLQAPGGFGKSTVLADWSRQHAAPVAWLTAARGDNSPRRFAVGLLSALCRAADESDALVGFLDVLADPSDLDLMLGRLLTVLNGLTDPLVVVVDDAHLLSAEVASHVIMPLTDHAGTARFVLGGTQGLTQWFGAALATGAAQQVEADVLALSIEEIGALLPQRSAGEAGHQAETLHHNTGGWPVAVRSALSGAVTVDAAGGAAPGMAVDDRLATYISSTILAELPSELADFILAATTCSRLTPALGEYLTGRKDAGKLLEECIRRGIFLDRYQDPEQSTLYRWHDVFARHCRTLLARADEPRVRELNRLAATGLRPHFPVTASIHAMRAHDAELSWDILRGSWLRLLVEGQAEALNSRCLALPPSLQGPELLLIRACCLSSLGDGAAAEVLAARVRSLLGQRPTPDPGMRFAAAFSQLFLAHDHQELADVTDEVAEVLRGASPAPYVDTHAQFLLGWAELRLRRDPAKVVQILTAARRDAQAAGAGLLARRAGLNLMFALTLGGRFNDVRALGRELDDAAAANPGNGWQHYDGGIEFVARGITAYWQDALQEAERQQRALITQGGAAAGYTALARIHFALTAAASGDARLVDEAARYLGDVSDEPRHGVAWPAYKILAAAALLAASGDRDRSMSLCQRLLPVGNIPMARVVAAEILRKGARPQSALEMLRGVGAAERVSYVNVSAWVTTATIMAGRAEHAQAHRLLEQALDVAVPEQIVRPLVIDPDDDVLRELLTDHAAWGSAHEGFLALRIADGESGVSREDLLGTALSPREREIFGFLCTTMTAAEIADSLFVSVNTVRTHQRAIYRKLGVGTRREAIKKYRL